VSASRSHSYLDLHPRYADNLGLSGHLFALRSQLLEAHGNDVPDVLHHFLIRLALSIARTQLRTLGHVIARFILLDDHLENVLVFSHCQGELLLFPRLIRNGSLFAISITSVEKRGPSCSDAATILSMVGLS